MRSLKSLEGGVQMENTIENAMPQERLADLVDRLPGGVGILHAQGGGFYLDYANEGWAAVHHISLAQGRSLIGKDTLSLVVEEDRHLILDAYGESLAREETQGTATYRIIGSDAGIYWIKVIFSFADQQDGIRYYYAAYTDVDDQKKTEQRLKESQTLLREAVSNSDIQYFTYFPGQNRGEIYAVNNRLSELPLIWNDFPDDFLDYTQASEEDKEAYRGMIRAIDEGADEARCTVRLAYKGIFSWEQLHIRAVRDASGKTVRGQGHSINVTRHMQAEERLRRERVRLKSLEGNVFEAFSFNISTNSEPDIQTSDQAMLAGTVDDALLKEAIAICPALSSTNPATREILLRAAARIPDTQDRARFIATCSGDAVRHAISEGRYSAEIRYRRYVGDVVRWVKSVAEVLPDPESGNLIAFYYTSDITREVITGKIAGQIISRNYKTVSFYDIQTGILFCRSGFTAEDEAFIDQRDYEDTMARALQGIVDPIERAAVQEQFTIENIVAQLAQKPVQTIYFSTVSPEDGSRLRMKEDAFYLDENRDIIVFLQTDITEIYEQERENREKMETALVAAKQASSAKSNFLSRMSHEIRTPLNAIIGMDAIAAQSIGNDEKIADCIGKIGISARFLLALINDILDMSRIESGKMLLKNDRFLFRDLMDNINSIIFNQTKAKGLDYECTVSSEIADAYIGDMMKLQQVLINILGNAVKFTARGKVSLDIHPLAGNNRESFLRFTVNDTGIGIREEFIDHIFDPFEQSDTTTTTTFGGTGLGLAITKSLVDLMGGSIKVRSIEGIGSEFTVDVPLTIDESMLVPPICDLHFEKMHTLIVDDDLIICEQTCEILKEIGMVGDWVTTGHEAVERVRRNYSKSRYYDYILVDWQMPEMDGIATTREIRKLVGPDVTIIIITAYDWEAIENEARAAGANLLISKPLLRTNLISAFQRAKNLEGPGEGREKTVDFTGKRVLVAEDNSINGEIARTLLESRNCEVVMAGNGLKALEAFTKSPTGYFDAILMDIRMPLMDGLQAATNIRHWSRDDAKTVPIIAMTANAFDEDVEKSKAVGMNAHLSKPIEPDLMFATLYRLMGGNIK
jgi:two-component system sensor histidine kinase/response regulator